MVAIVLSTSWKMRVETLETTVADHETRLTVNEENIQGKTQNSPYT